MTRDVEALIAQLKKVARDGGPESTRIGKAADALAALLPLAYAPDGTPWRDIAQKHLAGPNLGPVDHPLIRKLEDDYDFRCEAGPLKTCVDWQTLRESLAELLAERESQKPEWSSSP